MDEAQARSRRRQQRTKIFRSTLACARSLLVRSRRWGVFDFSSVTCCLLRLVPGARPRRVSSTAKAWKLSLAIFLIRKEPRAQPSKLYRGTDTEPCIFGPNGQKAQPNGPARCLFCDTVKLNDAFLQPNSSLTVKARFARLHADAQAVALQRVEDAGFRRWLEGSQRPARALVVEPKPPVETVRQVAAQKHKWDDRAAPYDPDFVASLHERGADTWREALARRPGLERDTWHFILFFFPCFPPPFFALARHAMP